MDPMMTIGIFLFFFGLFAFSLKIMISGKRNNEAPEDASFISTRPIRIIAVVVLILSLFIFLIFNRL